MSKSLSYTAVVAKQSENHTVFSFSAPADEILQFASIDQIGRTEKGTLKGFQRPQISHHIIEIREYLEGGDSVLPNPIVVAFTSGVTLKENGNKTAIVTIDISNGPSGLVVDGQQRLTALSGLPEKEFEVFVSGLICSSDEELRKQFILINNTKPLPKQLIYELLPTVNGLPFRLSSRGTAATLVERLNYEESSSLFRQIKQHTNPVGVITDTVLQKVIMRSLSDGAMRELKREENGLDKCFELIDNFYRAVQNVFSSDWEGHTPKTSRLVHGAGITCMGFVMEALHTMTGAISVQDFETGLAPLLGNSAWCKGYWDFGLEDQRKWNSIQNIHRDYLQLGQYLVRLVKKVQIN
jgi:DGQHR domain-containing protein